MSNIKNFLSRSISFTDTTLTIRFIVAYVFLTEGIQKFIYAEELGVGRFTKIGIPFPQFSAPAIGTLECLLALLILIGLKMRWASLLGIAIMLVALYTTKVELLFEKGFLPFSHQARNDLLMLFNCLFLFICGAKTRSLQPDNDGRS